MAPNQVSGRPPETPGWAQKLINLVRQIIRREPVLLAFMGAALAARIAFWVISNRMFEDGLTTITHARNVVLGLGLVHHIGEGNVHGFTSALGVLIPLAGEVVKQGAGITAIRLASLAAVCVALLYARLICSDLGMRAFPTAFVLAYLAFDQNMIFYGMSGMETQVAVAILLGGVHHVRRNDLITSGIFLGLAPLVRPEFVLWVAPAFLYLGLRNRARVAKTVTVAAAVVIPWIVFTFLYYGSPIPHTIIAKATIGRIPPILSGGSLLPWTEWLAVKVVGHTELLLRYVEPFYENWSTVTAPIPSPFLLAVVVIVADLVVIGLLASRRISNFWPVPVFLALFVAYRIYLLPIDHYSDWYMPPFLALLMIVAGLGLQQVASRAPKLSTTLAVVISIAFAIHMPFSFVLEAKVQAIENQVPRQTAEYLKENMLPGQSVVTEGAGYIGFYDGNQKLYDYPGLASPTSVRALQKLPLDQRNEEDMIAQLKPDWLVLRPWELDALHQKFPNVAAMYTVEHVVELGGVPESDLNVRGNRTVSFAGLADVDINEKYIILERTSPVGA